MTTNRKVLMGLLLIALLGVLLILRGADDVGGTCDGGSYMYDNWLEEQTELSANWVDVPGFRCLGDVSDAWPSIKAGRSYYPPNQCFGFEWDLVGFRVWEKWTTEAEKKKLGCFDISHVIIFFCCAYVPPTATPTDVPPTATPTDVPPTATPTDVPPTATDTSTPDPPTETPTNTPEDPTATPDDPTETPMATPTDTPEGPTPSPTSTPDDPTETPTATPTRRDPTPTPTKYNHGDTPTPTTAPTHCHTPTEFPNTGQETPGTPGPSEGILLMVELRIVVHEVPLGADGWDLSGIGDQAGLLEGTHAIAGHVSGAFGDLYKMVPGSVAFYNGIPYVVIEHELYDKGDLSAIGDGDLVLFTCSWWNGSEWTKRRIVILERSG